MRFCLPFTVWYNIHGFHSVQSRGILPFLSPPFLYRGRAGGPCPTCAAGCSPYGWCESSAEHDERGRG
nr:MAG TPA: cQ2-like, cysteine-rich, chitin-binding, PLANT PROTEIN [Caudoviricetes sp.]